EQLLAGGRALPRFSIHRLESRLAWVVAALFSTALVAWLGIAFGLPALAKEVAFRLPAASEPAIGGDAPRALDSTPPAPSAWPPKRQADIQALFRALQSELPGTAAYRLELRAGGRFGANALALPSGIIILTDQLANLAQNDQELLAVLAHEIGH